MELSYIFRRKLAYASLNRTELPNMKIENPENSFLGSVLIA